VQRTQVDDLVRRIYPEPIDPELGNPVERVIHQITPDFTAIGAVEVPSFTPEGPVPVGKVGTELLEIVALRTEMVVDHIEHDGESFLVACINQSAETGGPAIGALRRVQRCPVVSPITASGELRHRHDLDGGDAQLAELGQVLDDSFEGAHWCKGADVQLVENQLGGRDALPVT
jgi:hypothetical protein